MRREQTLAVLDPDGVIRQRHAANLEPEIA